MEKKTIKILISILIFCIILNQEPPQTPSKNLPQIKSSVEDYANITMENIKDTSLKFKIESTRDVTAFRLFYITNHTNGSSINDELGGMGDILGLDIIPTKLRIWSVSINSLKFYNEGGYLYTFLMDVYSINPLDGERVYAGQFQPDPPPVIIEPDPVIDDPDPTDEEKKNLTWLFVILGISVIGAGGYGIFRLNRLVDQSHSNDEPNRGENINSQSADALERRRMRVRKNRNRRNN